MCGIRGLQPLFQLVSGCFTPFTPDLLLLPPSTILSVTVYSIYNRFLLFPFRSVVSSSPLFLLRTQHVSLVSISDHYDVICKVCSEMVRYTLKSFVFLFSYFSFLLAHVYGFFLIPLLFLIIR